MRSMDCPWIFTRDVSSICLADPHDVRCLMEIVPESVIPYAIPLAHDGVSFWTWVIITHGDHWCIL
jgi:hypothetical protein